MRTLFIIFEVISLSFFITACSSEDPKINIKSVFISEMLENRTDEHYTSDSEKHDKGCKGFYEKHFNYEQLNSLDSVNVNILENNTGLRWTKYYNSDKLIDFEAILKERYLNKVIYVVEVIEAVNSIEKDFLVGGDDGLQVWVNGKFIFEVHDGRYSYKEELIKFNLKKGRNIILYKIDQSYGGWQLTRQFPSKEDVKIILSELKYEVYADLPEYCIVPDSIDNVDLKPDRIRKERLLRKNNLFTNLSITWKNFEKGKLVVIKNEKDFTSLPSSLKIPDKFNGKGAIEFSAKGENGLEYYKEEIPIYYESIAEKLSKSLVDKSIGMNDPVIAERRNAVIDLFHLDKTDTINIKRSYSTRVKAHGLFDLSIAMENIGEKINVQPGPTIMGYYSDTVKRSYMYRAYFPNNGNDKTPLLYVIPHMQVIDQPDNQKFLHRTSGRHSVVSLWTKLSAIYNFLIVQSEGQGLKNFSGSAVEEIPLIINQLSKITDIDTSKIYFYCTSSGAVISLQMLVNLDLNIKAVGFSGGSFNNVDYEKIIKALKIIKKKYPELLFFIRHGDKDKRYPMNKMRKFIDILRDMDFEVDFNVVKGGSHTLNYSVIAQEFFRTIDNRI